MNLVSEADLLTWTGYAQRAALERWLTTHGVRYWRTTRGQICTTQTAVDAALIGQGKKPMRFRGVS